MSKRVKQIVIASLAVLLAVVIAVPVITNIASADSDIIAIKENGTTVNGDSRDVLYHTYGTVSSGGYDVYLDGDTMKLDTVVDQTAIDSWLRELNAEYSRTLNSGATSPESFGSRGAMYYTRDPGLVAGGAEDVLLPVVDNEGFPVYEGCCYYILNNELYSNVDSARSYLSTSGSFGTVDGGLKVKLEGVTSPEAGKFTSCYLVSEDGSTVYYFYKDSSSNTVMGSIPYAQRNASYAVSIVSHLDGKPATLAQLGLGSRTPTEIVITVVGYGRNGSNITEGAVNVGLTGNVWSDDLYTWTDSTAGNDYYTIDVTGSNMVVTITSLDVEQIWLALKDPNLETPWTEQFQTVALTAANSIYYVQQDGSITNTPPSYSQAGQTDPESQTPPNGNTTTTGTASPLLTIPTYSDTPTEYFQIKDTAGTLSTGTYSYGSHRYNWRFERVYDYEVETAEVFFVEYKWEAVNHQVDPDAVDDTDSRTADMVADISDTGEIRIYNPGTVTFVCTATVDNGSTAADSADLNGLEIEKTFSVTYTFEKYSASSEGNYLTDTSDEIHFPDVDEPGSVTISKNSYGGVTSYTDTGVANIVLDVKSLADTEPVDIVMVIDASRSMVDFFEYFAVFAEGDRIQYDASGNEVTDESRTTITSVSYTGSRDVTYAIRKYSTAAEAVPILPETAPLAEGEVITNANLLTNTTDVNSSAYKYRGLYYIPVYRHSDLTGSNAANAQPVYYIYLDDASNSYVLCTLTVGDNPQTKDVVETAYNIREVATSVVLRDMVFSVGSTAYYTETQTASDEFVVNYDKITAARNSASAFVNTLLDASPESRVALVQFANDSLDSKGDFYEINSRVITTYTNDRAKLLSLINNNAYDSSDSRYAKAGMGHEYFRYAPAAAELDALESSVANAGLTVSNMGGTNYGLAFLHAEKAIASDPNPSAAAERQILIFMTDGEPNYLNLGEDSIFPYNGNNNNHEWLNTIAGGARDSRSWAFFALRRELQAVNRIENLGYEIVTIGFDLDSDGTGYFADYGPNVTNGKVFKFDTNKATRDYETGLADDLGLADAGLSGYDLLIALRKRVVENIATFTDGYYSVEKDAESGAADYSSLNRAYEDIAETIFNFTTDAEVTDVVGDDFELRLLPYYNGNETVSPTIVITSADLVVKGKYTGADGDLCYSNKINSATRKDLETVTFTGSSLAEGITYTCTDAEGNKKQGTIDSADYTINGHYFTYNSTSKTFEWTVGDIINQYYSLSYDAYLTGSDPAYELAMGRTTDEWLTGNTDTAFRTAAAAESLPTNENAVIRYRNYNEEYCQQTYEKPYEGWKTTSVTVLKNWASTGGQNGNQPTYITVQLQKSVNGGEFADVYNPRTLSNSNGWTTTWTELPLNEDGRDIEYRVIETDVPDAYTVSTKESPENYFTITNTLREIDVSVEKVWEDDNNVAGFRTGSVQVTLRRGAANGEQTVYNETVDTSTITDRYTWENLPLYVNGQLMAYSVAESTVPTGYTAVYSSTTDSSGNMDWTITNTHVPEKVDITVTKSWDDNSDSEGFRPDDITVYLSGYAGSRLAVSRQAEVTGDGDVWSYTWKDLPKHADGVEIVYSVDEDSVANYTKEIDGMTITNTHETTETSVTVIKYWDDAGNQDGERPGTVTLVLTGSNGYRDEVVLSSSHAVEGDSNRWTYTWRNLPQYDDGVQITYSVDEVRTAELAEIYPEYSKSSAGHTWVLTNKHVPATTEVSVNKVWADDSNRDGVRPSTVTMTLTGTDGSSRTVTLPDSDGKWNYTWTNLPVNHNGTPITYNVTETLPEGYTDKYTVGYEWKGNAVTVTNTHYIATTGISVNKVWEDDSNRDGVRPATVTMTLTGTDGSNRTVTLPDADGKWNYTWTNLPVNHNGTPITYNVTETLPEGYAGKYDVDYEWEGNAVTVTNTHTPETVSITVNKNWDDDSDRDGIRPEEITVYLMNGSVKAAEKTITAAGGWTCTFEGLPRYENGGTEIAYTVTDSVEGYEASSGNSAGGVINITNSHDNETTEVSVVKNWDDHSDLAGFRPDSITVNLLADGNEIDEVVLSEANGWRYTFEDLNKHRDSGTEIVYTVTEDAVANYTADIKGSAAAGFVITNKHEVEYVSIPVTKTWVDESDQDGIRPDAVTVHLLANGIEVESVEISESDGWKHTFSGYPAYENGVRIVYTITEDAVEGYRTVISGYAITNTHDTDTVSVTVSKYWDDNNDQDGMRDDSVTVQLYANDVPCGDAVVLNDGNKWTHTWNDLDKNAAGDPIDYSVAETSSHEGYVADVSETAENVFQVTNSHETTETTITVVKKWEDDGDAKGVRPESISVNLLAFKDSETIENADVLQTVTLSEENGWERVFRDLPVYEDGELIHYFFAEPVVPEGYTAAVGAFINNKVTITNTIQLHNVTVRYEDTAETEIKDAATPYNGAVKGSDYDVLNVGDGKNYKPNTIEFGGKTYVFTNIKSGSDEESGKLTENKEITYVYTVVTDPEVTKAVSEELVNVTDGSRNVTYTVTVKNTSEFDMTDVRVSDELPAGMAYVSGGDVYADGVVTWTIDEIAAGDTESVTFVASISADTSVWVFNNKAEVTEATVDANGKDVTIDYSANPIESNEVRTSAFKDPSIEKSVNTSLIHILDESGNTAYEIVYTIKVTNPNNVAITNVTVSDVIPDGLAYVSGGSCTDGVVSWTIGSISANGSAEVSFTARLGESTPGAKAPYENIAQIDSFTIIPEGYDEAVTSTQTIVSNEVVTDIQLYRGVKVNYEDTQDTVIRDSENPYVNAEKGSDYDVLNVGDGKNYKPNTIEFGGKTYVFTRIKNGSDEESGKLTENKEITYVYTVVTDPEVTKAVSDRLVNVTDGSKEVTYTVTVKNTSEFDMTDVRVSDELPEGMAYVSGGDVYADGVVTWTIDEIAAGDTESVTFVASISADTSVWVFDNKAEVTEVTVDANGKDVTIDYSANPIESNEVVTGAYVDPTISKVIVDGASRVTSNLIHITDESGTTKYYIDYVLTVRNPNGFALTNVTVSDNVPVGLAYVSGGDSCTDGVVSWTIGSISANGSAEVSFRAVIADADAEVSIALGDTAPYINTARITGMTVDPDGTPAEGSTAPDVEAHVITGLRIDSNTVQTDIYKDPTIVKDADKHRATVGETVTYIVTVTNEGRVPLYRLHVTDRLPDGMEFVAVGGRYAYMVVNDVPDDFAENYPDAPAGVTPEGNILSADIPCLAGGGTAIITIYAKITDASYIHYTNTAVLDDAYLSYEATDPVVENLTDNAETDIISEPYIEKSVDKASAQQGETLTYTVTVHNPTAEDITDAVVTDVLPEGLSCTAGNYDEKTRTLTWDGISIESGKSHTVTFTAKVENVDDYSKYTNTAYLTSVRIDADGDGDMDDVTYTDKFATAETTPLRDPYIVKADDKDFVREGDRIQYTLVVYNPNEFDLLNVEIRDPVPAGLNVVLKDGTVAETDGGELTWTIDRIPAGQNGTDGSRELTFIVEVTDRSDAIYYNTAYIDKAVIDTDGDSVDDTAEDAEETGDRLLVYNTDPDSAADDNASNTVDADVYYDITVEYREYDTNAENNHGTELKEAIEQFNNRNGSEYDAGTVAPNALPEIIITESGEVWAKKEVSANADPVTGRFDSDKTVVVLYEKYSSLFTVSKQVSIDKAEWTEEVTVTPGTPVYFRIIVTNCVPYPISGLELSDRLVGTIELPLPNAWESLIDAFPGNLAANANWTSEPMTLDTTGFLGGDRYVNTASVSDQDANTPDLTDDATVRIVAPGELTLTKNANVTADETTGLKYVSPGRVSFTIQVTNTGASVLRDVRIVDDTYDVIVIDAETGAETTVPKGTVIRTVETLAVGETVSVTVYLDIPEESHNGQNYRNFATATAKDQNGNEVDPSTDDDTVIVTKEVKPVLSIVKTVNNTDARENPLTVAPGEKLTYTITVINSSDIAAEDVYVLDYMHVDGTRLTDSWAIDKGWVVDVPANGSYTIEDVVCDIIMPKAPAGTVINNVVELYESEKSYTDREDPIDDDIAKVQTDAVYSIDIVKAADVSVLEPGDEAGYIIYVTNTGNTVLTDIIVSEALDGTWGALPTETEGKADVSVTKNSSDNTLTVSELQPEDSVRFSFTYDIAEDIEEDTVTNTVTAEAETPDGESVSDEDEVTVTIFRNRLQLVKTAMTDTAAPGGTVQFLITVTNTGDSELRNVVVTDDLDVVVVKEQYAVGSGNMTDVTVPSAERLDELGVDEDDYDGTVIGFFATLRPEEVRFITVEYTIPENAEDGSKVYNNAVAEADGGHEATGSDEVEVDVPVVRDYRMTITKAANVQDAKAGQTVQYTITVTNTGASDLTNVVITDSLPVVYNGTTYPTGQTIRTIALLESGKSETITVSYVVPEGGTNTSLVNTAKADSAETDEITATATIVIRRPGISVKKTVNTQNVIAGQKVYYTITVTNTGNCTLEDLKVADAKIGYSFTIDKLEPGKSWTSPSGELYYTFNSNAAVGASFKNDVNVSNGEVKGATDTATAVVTTPNNYSGPNTGAPDYVSAETQARRTGTAWIVGVSTVLLASAAAYVFYRRKRSSAR